jgi:hypothetical protein
MTMAANCASARWFRSSFSQAGEQLAAAVEPRVRAFDDHRRARSPCPTAAARFAPPTDVPRKPAVPGRHDYVGGVVALVAAELQRGVRWREDDVRV